MKIEISGRHVEITESLRTHILEKSEKIEHHVEKWATKLHIILTVEQYKEKENKCAEAVLHLKNNKELISKDISDDMYTAITNMFKNLDKQAIKYKDKHSDHHE